jgi:hypothetical protein
MLCALLTPIPELSVCLSPSFGVSNLMKKLVYSALALSVTSAGALASDTDWSTLDQEIEALTASTALDTTGPNIGGRIRTLYLNSSDLDVGDFDVEDARLSATGSRGDYSYKLQVDFADDGLLDAYIDFPLGGQVKGRFGQFKAGLSRSALISSGDMFFAGRNVIGETWSGRAEGFQISGEFDQLGWWLTIQDGADAAGDDYLIAGRVAFDLMGDGASSVEGAYGGTEAPSATAALGFWDDGGADDVDGTVLEFHGGTNVYSFGVDLMSIGDGGAPTTNGDPTVLEGDSSPMSVMGTYMLQPDTWELGVRYEDADNASSDSMMSIGVVNYLDGHNLKWTIQYNSVSSDDDAREVDGFAVQLQLGF